jgi:hypothetical protein
MPPKLGFQILVCKLLWWWNRMMASTSTYMKRLWINYLWTWI